MSIGRLSTFIRRLRGDMAAGQTGGLSDAQLLDRWLVQRDQAAFEVLLWRHGPMIHSVCRRVLNHDADVEDAFQAAFLLLVRKAAAIRRSESVAAWLYRTAYRVALRARQRAAKQSSRETNGVEWLGTNASEDVVWRDVRPLLDEEINRLPEKYRIPFIRCYLEGCTNEEAAVEMGCPLGTIHSRLAWARERLRFRLTRRGVTLAGAGLTALLVHNAASAVPPALAQTTLQAAFAYAAPSTTASAGAVALANEVLRSMFLARLKLGAAVVAALMLCGGGVAFFHQTEAADSPGNGEGPAASPTLAPQPTLLGRLAEPPGEVRRFPVEEWAWSVSFSPDGQQIVIGTGGTGVPVRVYEVSSGKEVLRTMLYNSCWSVAYSPNGKFIVVGSGTKPIQILDARTGQVCRELPVNAGRVRNVTFSPDGRLIASSHQDGWLRLWDVAQRKVLHTFPADNNAVHSAAFTPDGKLLLVIDPDMTLRLYDVGSGKEVRRFKGHTSRVTDVAVSADGRRALSCGDETLRLWDLTTDTELLRLDQRDGPHGVAFCPDGRRALSTGNKTVHLWDLTTGRELHCFTDHQGAVCCVAVSRDGQYAASGSSDHTVRLWRLPDPEGPRAFFNGSKQITIPDASSDKAKRGQPEPDESSAAAALERIGAGIRRDDNLPGRPVVDINLTQTQVTDADLKDLKVFKSLRGLHLGVTRVTNAGLKDLKELRSLGWLDLPLTQVTDEILKDLKDLQGLQLLNLGGTRVTDAGLEHLRGLKTLRLLDLTSTPVTDAGLKHLKELKSLQRLVLSRTQVTDAGVQDLREALPSCQIDK